MDLLDVDPHLMDRVMDAPRSDMTPEEAEAVNVVVAGARALWALSTSQKNKEAMRKTGVVRLLARLLRLGHNDIIVPIMGTVQQCATEVTPVAVGSRRAQSGASTSLWLFLFVLQSNFQLAIQTEGMIPDLVDYLRKENTEIQKHCASAIFKVTKHQPGRFHLLVHAAKHFTTTLHDTVLLKNVGYCRLQY